MTDAALLIVFSPAGPALTVPRATTTALAITYVPPLRPSRVAPPSLRAAPAGLTATRVEALLSISLELAGDRNGR